MPRNSSGVYSLPESPFIPGTVIESAPVNSNFSDIATALTQSLATGGESAMTGPFYAANGSLTEPSISFNNSPGTGWYRVSADTVGFVVAGVLAYTVTSGRIADFEVGIKVGNAAVADVTLLDWYEEGSFTPTFAFTGGGVGVTYSLRNGAFTRFGNLVFFTIRITLTSKGSSTGQVRITGLPFAPADFDNCMFFPVAGMSGTVGDQDLMGSVDGAVVAVRLFEIAGGIANELDDSDFTNTASFTITGTYRA